MDFLIFGATPSRQKSLVQIVFLSRSMNESGLFSKRASLFLLSVFLFFSACSAPHFLNSIRNIEQFKMLEGEPLSMKYGGITAVKVLYDIRHKSVYFIHSKRYKFHFNFARSQLNNTDELQDFNEKNYHPNPQREYVFATINHYKGSDLYTYEFASSEKMSSEAIQSFEVVKKKIFVGGNLRFFPATAEQIADTRKLSPGLALISAEEVFQQITYQPIVCKESYGYLRKMDIRELSKSVITQRDIVLVNGTPNEVPLCAGLITTQLQPPLSHINILCHNRGTPMMAFKNVWENAYINSLQGQLLHFVVRNDTCSLSPANVAEAAKFWNSTRKKAINPLYNLLADTLIDLKKKGYGILAFAGGKAAGFAELMRVQEKYPGEFSVPAGAFAIPFYFYQQHVQQPAVAKLISDLLHDSSVINKPAQLKKQLKDIRKAIKDEAINPELIKAVTEKIRTANCGPAFRFRSSTNAEDIPGFNGAGLYESKTGILGDTKKTIEKAITSVWAGLWNERAFLERYYFGIPQDKVFMGILCHQAQGTEELNGVAITKNIYRPEVPGNVINMQKGESSIVIPTDSKVSEHTVLLVSHTWGEPTFAVDYISYSSLNDFKPLLTMDEYKKLAAVLNKVEAHFYRQVDKRKTDFADYALDIEFKLIGPKRKLLLKQARVYND